MSNGLIWLILGLIALHLVNTRRQLIGNRLKIERAWANLDVLLQQRHVWLVRLVDFCTRYMIFEKQLLERVVRAREQVELARTRREPALLGRAEQTLRGDLVHLYIAANAHKELVADENFQQLQQRIRALAAAIAARAQAYNESVAVNNSTLDRFPHIIVARAFNIQGSGRLSLDRS